MAKSRKSQPVRKSTWEVLVFPPDEARLVFQKNGARFGFYGDANDGLFGILVVADHDKAAPIAVNAFRWSGSITPRLQQVIDHPDVRSLVGRPHRILCLKDQYAVVAPAAKELGAVCEVRENLPTAAILAMIVRHGLPELPTEGTQERGREKPTTPDVEAMVSVLEDMLEESAAHAVPSAQWRELFAAIVRLRPWERWDDEMAITATSTDPLIHDRTVLILGLAGVHRGFAIFATRNAALEWSEKARRNPGKAKVPGDVLMVECAPVEEIDTRTRRSLLARGLLINGFGLSLYVVRPNMQFREMTESEGEVAWAMCDATLHWAAAQAGEPPVTLGHPLYGKQPKVTVRGEYLNLFAPRPSPEKLRSPPMVQEPPAKGMPSAQSPVGFGSPTPAPPSPLGLPTVHDLRNAGLPPLIDGEISIATGRDKDGNPVLVICTLKAKAVTAASRLSEATHLRVQDAGSGDLDIIVSGGDTDVARLVRLDPPSFVGMRISSQKRILVQLLQGGPRARSDNPNNYVFQKWFPLVGG